MLLCMLYYLINFSVYLSCIHNIVPIQAVFIFYIILPVQGMYVAVRMFYKTSGRNYTVYKYIIDYYL